MARALSGVEMLVIYLNMSQNTEKLCDFSTTKVSFSDFRS